MREERRRAVGLARPLPAMSGAEPWTASKMDASLPMLPEGVRPRPPMRPADKSERMSPYLTGSARLLRSPDYQAYRLGMTMTRSAKGAGSWVMRRQTRSRMSSVYLMFEYSLATSRQAFKNMPSDIFMTPALCTAVTSGRPFSDA